MNIVVCELTVSGWRALSEDGTVLEIDGAKPPRFAVTPSGKPIYVPKPTRRGRIDKHLDHARTAVRFLKSGDLHSALQHINDAIKVAPSLRARYNRAMILLAMGYWQEGLREYAACESFSPFFRPLSEKAKEYGIPPWEGQSLNGKRLLLISDHGFGDAIMSLRYVNRLKSAGAEVIILVTEELRRVAEQFAHVVTDIVEADYFCNMLSLLVPLEVSVTNVPSNPYVTVNKYDIADWRRKLNTKKKLIGVAWSVGKFQEDDYPRPIAPELLINRLQRDDVELISVQQQRAEGIKSFPIKDFADCAALMMCMDRIVSVDTAALHLAGAIGHRNVHALLSYWHSWRWRWQTPWYNNIHFHIQAKPNDWSSALNEL